MPAQTRAKLTRTEDIDSQLEIRGQGQSAGTFMLTRSCAALRAADLDWIVGPGYSWGGYVWGVLNVSFCASGTQLGLDFLSIDFFVFILYLSNYSFPKYYVFIQS